MSEKEPNRRRKAHVHSTQKMFPNSHSPLIRVNWERVIFMNFKFILMKVAVYFIALHKLSILVLT
jgi:hypothetical protein